MFYADAAVFSRWYLFCTGSFHYCKYQYSTALDVPENATLLVGLFRENRLIGVTLYQGGKTITGNFAQDMSDGIAEATDVKAFLWDMRQLTPLCNAFSSQIKNLPSAEKILVVYYSRSNNTKLLTKTVHNRSGGDIARIEPVNPYPENHSECLAQVQKEEAVYYG